MQKSKSIKEFIPLLKNKYIITSLIFIVWMTFFDQNNILDRIRLSQRISDLKNQKEHYEKEIELNSQKIQELEGSREKLEKFAREQYRMKKSDEELFIIIEK
ncbi:septum formation initiator family protein [Marinilabiliaceae bacterium ANBcel2]|nr:septum formation initiator family protein [Marinilabiliaceae bacterium ANBcel2]